MVNKSIHRTNQFRIPCPQCTHSILVTEKPQAMFAAFQILSFERSGIADQLHKKHLSPIRPEGTNVQRQKSCVSVQHFAPVPLFGRARSTSRYRMPPVLPSVGPEATLRTPDFRLPAIRPTFILRPFRTNLSTPKIKKVANECLQPSRPPGRLRREGDSNP